VTWHDFEVANLPSGKPTLKLSGVAAQVAEADGRTRRWRYRSRIRRSWGWRT